MKIVSNKYVVDSDIVRRTWKEILFSRPWNPLCFYKLVDAPKAYYLQDTDTLIVSPKTYSKINEDSKLIDDLRNNNLVETI